MLQGNVKARQYFIAAEGNDGVVCPWRVQCQNNSQKHSLVHLTKGQTAYGLRHLVQLLTTLASIYKVRTVSQELLAKTS